MRLGGAVMALSSPVDAFSMSDGLPATRLRHQAKNTREFNIRRRPVTPKVAGSSPVAPAILIVFQ